MGNRGEENGWLVVGASASVGGGVDTGGSCGLRQ